MGVPCRMAALGDWSFKDLGRDSQGDLLDRISLSVPVDIGTGNAWWRAKGLFCLSCFYLSFQYNWSTSSSSSTLSPTVLTAAVFAGTHQVSLVDRMAPSWQLLLPSSSGFLHFCYSIPTLVSIFGHSSSVDWERSIFLSFLAFSWKNFTLEINHQTGRTEMYSPIKFSSELDVWFCCFV